MQIEPVPIDSIHEDPANPRLHGPGNLARIKASLARFGQRKPLVVRKGIVIAGNGTLRAARELGWTEVRIVRADDLSDVDAAAFGIADNRASDPVGDEPLYDEEALVKILAEIAKEIPEFTDEAMLSAENLAQMFQPETESVSRTEETLDEPSDEDALDLIFKSPFPYFGGKARIARKVWERFGTVTGYIEPFFGSGAVLLNRPLPLDGKETVNDADGFVSNFWRAVQKDPDAVAEHADFPVIENDLHARHAWLVGQKESMQARLEGDPEWSDPKIAGWWVWGMSLWIGGGFCSGAGPWKIVDGQLVRLIGEGQGVKRSIVSLTREGRGISRQRVHLSSEGQGVSRRRVNLSSEGTGVSRKSVHLGDEGPGNPGTGEQGLLAWMRALSERLRLVRVCCGDWSRICGGDSGDAISHFFSGDGACGVFLDPPYADTAGRDPDIYTVDSLSVAHAVREWALAHGDDPRLRIALCGYEDEHDMPGSWQKVSWKAGSGFSSLGKGETAGKVNRFRERIWFSPHCLPGRGVGG